jgi:hypothetical protein
MTKAIHKEKKSKAKGIVLKPDPARRVDLEPGLHLDPKIKDLIFFLIFQPNPIDDHK